MKNILKNLNPKQKMAVEITGGPVLILAGPGSGKTRVLTHKIAYLIQEGVAPENILAVTFTNKAAGEMKQRVASLINTITIPFIGTFHAFCLKILKKEINKLGYKKTFVIYDKADQLSLIKKTITKLQIDKDQFKPTIISSIISSIKSELINYNTYQESAQNYFEEITASIYRTYQLELKQNNAVDFDDLIMLAVDLFQEFPKILKEYQEQFKYILIDEYQDTNPAQYQFIKLLAKKYKNICAVGDDAQAIYGFRQADFRNILNFEKDYPSAKTVILNQNYRSTKNILNTAKHIINKNIYQKEKTLWTKNPKGAPVAIVKVSDEIAEREFVIEKIKELKKESGLNLNEFTILYRTNAQSRALEEGFIQHKIPYKIIGSVKFYQRKEIKDILAYLALLLHPKDKISFQRIINVPSRGIGKRTEAKIIQTSLETIAKQNPNVKKFLLFLKKAKQILHTEPLSNLIKFVLKETNYKKYLETNYQNRSYLENIPEYEIRWHNINELFTVTRVYDDFKPPKGAEKFLEDTALFSEGDEVETEKNLVNLMTLHAAKGLEFPIVFITGCEEGIFPHARSMINPSEIEEERRLCYVGATRAKECLFLTFAQKRTLFGLTQVNPSSRFINDIPENLIDYQMIEEEYNEFDF